MARFKITRTFVAVEIFEVEAESAEEAEQAYIDGDAGEPDTEWGETIDLSVEEV